MVTKKQKPELFSGFPIQDSFLERIFCQYPQKDKIKKPPWFQRRLYYNQNTL